MFALVLHKVLMPSGTRTPDQMLDPSSHLHLSFELSHGWTDTKVAEQRHLIFPALDLRTAGGWDLNIGVGRGLTGGSEHWGVKWIVGLRLPR